MMTPRCMACCRMTGQSICMASKQASDCKTMPLEACATRCVLQELGCLALHYLQADYSRYASFIYHSVHIRGASRAGTNNNLRSYLVPVQTPPPEIYSCYSGYLMVQISWWQWQTLKAISSPLIHGTNASTRLLPSLSICFFLRFACGGAVCTYRKLSKAKVRFSANF